MKLSFPSALLAIISTLLFCHSCVYSQTDDKLYFGDYTIQDLQTESENLQNFLNNILRVDISVSEADVSGFFRELQKQSPVNLNIIVKDDAKKIKLPPIKLTNVNAAAAINAASIATNGVIKFYYDETGQIGYVDRQPGSQNSRVSVLNLADVLSTHSNESFLSAVEIGMDIMGNKNSGITMKLHSETKTLFLRGAPEEIAMIEELVHQLAQNQKNAQQTAIQRMLQSRIGGGLGSPGMVGGGRGRAGGGDGAGRFSDGGGAADGGSGETSTKKDKR